MCLPGYQRGNHQVIPHRSPHLSHHLIPQVYLSKEVLSAYITDISIDMIVGRPTKCMCNESMNSFF